MARLQPIEDAIAQTQQAQAQAERAISPRLRHGARGHAATVTSNAVATSRPVTRLATKAVSNPIRGASF